MLGNQLLNSARPIIGICLVALLASLGTGAVLLYTTGQADVTAIVLNYFIIIPLALSGIIALQLLLLRWHNK